MKSLKCAFDIHKWIEDKVAMENVCERCGISYHKYAKRRSGSVWFCSLRIIYLVFLSGLWIWLRGPDREYFSGKRVDPSFKLTKKLIFSRIMLKIMFVIIPLFWSLYTFFVFLSNMFLLFNECGIS